MATDLHTFLSIYNLVMKPENYIPRGYQTIGGMWTIDTWKFKEITVQLMDEGYTRKLFTSSPDIEVLERNNELTFIKGTIIDLDVRFYSNFFDIIK